MNASGKRSVSAESIPIPFGLSAFRKIRGMCFLIAIAVPRNAVERVCTEHASRGRHIAPTSNASARSAAGTDRLPLLVTTGGCSCDWYKPPSDSESGSKITRARARWARMGWSSAKIERALAGMSRSPGDALGLHPAVIGLLRSVAQECGSVAVWVHDFSGDVEVEDYAIKGRERWAWEEMASRASMLRTDTVAEIGAERPDSSGARVGRA
ncbi:MAG: hypothetical protein RIS21_394 [Planctomycetota bacterium]|jgi:hypothetical protein